MILSTSYRIIRHWYFKLSRRFLNCCKFWDFIFFILFFLILLRTFFNNWFLFLVNKICRIKFKILLNTRIIDIWKFFVKKWHRNILKTQLIITLNRSYRFSPTMAIRSLNCNSSYFTRLNCISHLVILILLFRLLFFFSCSEFLLLQLLLLNFSFNLFSKWSVSLFFIILVIIFLLFNGIKFGIILARFNVLLIIIMISTSFIVLVFS